MKMAELDKLDEFAKAAMQGMCSHPRNLSSTPFGLISQLAYAQAQSMIKERAILDAREAEDRAADEMEKSK